jgi:hypothetical protein
MHGLPDAEVERNLHPRLVLVVGLRNLNLDRNPLGVRGDLPHVRDALGTTKKAEELLGQARVAQADMHELTFLDGRGRDKSRL